MSVTKRFAIVCTRTQNFHTPVFIQDVYECDKMVQHSTHILTPTHVCSYKTSMSVIKGYSIAHTQNSHTLLFT